MVEYLSELQTAINGMDLTQLGALAVRLRQKQLAGQKLFVCGNGGSHSVAEHWGVDLIKAGHLETVTLGTNPALSTAIANDHSYEIGLSTELLMRATSADLVVCLSCSGRSRNILSVLREAEKLQMEAYLITSYTAPQPVQATTIRIPTKDYGVLEDIFGIIGHWLTRELS